MTVPDNPTYPDCAGYARFETQEQAAYVGIQLVHEFGGRSQIAHHGDHWHVRQIDSEST